MNYFLDQEFHEYHYKPLFGRKVHIIDLISIGIVSEDGREYYAICKEFDIKAAWNSYQMKMVSGDARNIYPEGIKEYWLRDNVLKPIFNSWKYEANGKILRLGLLPIGLNEDKFTFKNFEKVISYIGKTRKQIAKEVYDFVASPEMRFDGQMGYYSQADYLKINSPTFYGYYADYDWVLFCSLFGKMMDLPKGFPMYCRDLKQMLDEENFKRMPFDINFNLGEGWQTATCEPQQVKDLPNYPKQTNEHNALADARWNRELYKFIEGL